MGLLEVDEIQADVLVLLCFRRRVVSEDRVPLPEGIGFDAEIPAVLLVLLVTEFRVEVCKVGMQHKRLEYAATFVLPILKREVIPQSVFHNRSADGKLL